MKSGPARRVTPRPAGRGRRPSPLSIPEKRSGPPPVRRPGKPDPRIGQSALPKSVKGLDDVRPGGSRPRCPECFGNRGLLRCGTKGSNPFPSSEEERPRRCPSYGRRGSDAFVQQVLIAEQLGQELDRFSPFMALTDIGMSPYPVMKVIGSWTMIMVTSSDITEQKRAEEAPRQSEEQWREVFEHNPLMYFIVSRTGTL